MPDPATPRTVQQYLDETPNWSDGTRVASAPMTAMQWRIFGLATAGKFFEGLVVFMTGVALPLVALEYDLDATGKGLMSAASLFGILIGATALGGLADRFGRRALFIFEMALFTVFLVLTALSTSFPFLVICLFGMGLALGCDYPTAHLVISESIPSAARGRLVLSAFGFQAVGALAGTILGFLILKASGSEQDWRTMYGVAVLPALLVVVGRFFVTQSPHWLVVKGRLPDAERELGRLLHRVPPYPSAIRLAPPVDGQAHTARGHAGPAALFVHPRARRATILASVPWFLQDLGTYGIGIFTPTILAATLGATNPHEVSLAQVVFNAKQAAEGAALIDILLIIGIGSAILLADRVGRIPLQVIGFIGCAAGLGIAALSTFTSGVTNLVLIFAGFMLFNFMTNMGPNAMTYLIAGEVFPTSVRGLGAGFAASFAKIGAVLTAFFFPIILHQIGTATLLFALAATSLLGAWITARFAIETKGLSLERIGMDEPPSL